MDTVSGLHAPETDMSLVDELPVLRKQVKIQKKEIHCLRENEFLERQRFYKYIPYKNCSWECQKLVETMRVTACEANTTMFMDEPTCKSAYF